MATRYDPHMGPGSELAARNANTKRGQLQLPGATRYHYRPCAYPPRTVCVRLDALLIRKPEIARHPNGAGIQMCGEVAGTTHWIPTVECDWLGRVTYSVRHFDGRVPLRMCDQLIPAYALCDGWL